MADDCIFCKIVSGELPSTQVDADERTVSFMDINPVTRGHVLILPRTHCTDVHDIDPEDLAACAATGKRLARRAVDALSADGVNLFNAAGSAAGQTVFHFHMHVIPRYHGDGLRAPVGGAPGDPEEIARTAEALRE